MRVITILILILFTAACSDESENTASPQAPIARTKVVVIGDSISTGFGVATPWTKHFEKELNIDLVNAAVKNQETPFGLSIIDEVLAREKPNHVIILMGTNDAVRGSVSNALVNLQKMVDIGIRHNATVILGTLPPIYGNSYRNHQSKMISDRIPYIKGCKVARVRERFGDDPTLFVDKLHPTDAGQLKIAEAFITLFRDQQMHEL